MAAMHTAALLALSASVAAAAAQAERPNLLFLHDESTDGRTYQRDMGHLVPIPNIRKLQDRGVNFVNFYCNVPICAPSRASVWSGRQPHNGLHKHNNITVRGYWNNYEGVGACSDPETVPSATHTQTHPTGGSGRRDGCAPSIDGKVTVTEKQLIAPMLEAGGYHTMVTGKTDWAAGGHSLTTMVDSWSIYARFPYSIPENGGWHIWGDCGGNLTVAPKSAETEIPGWFENSAHTNDWKIVNSSTAWIKSAEAKQSTPWFLFQAFTNGFDPNDDGFHARHGMNIVHPPYDTDAEHFARIPVDDVTIPEWPKLDPGGPVHPCDKQASMKKGCALPADWPTESGPGQNTDAHKRAIRAGYYAMIAEYDDMIGGYVQAVEDAGMIESTIIVCAADHGDMQMEHQQFYKMVAFEASTRVPLVIAGPGISKGIEILSLHSLVDLLPTFLDLAGAKVPEGHTVDGHSLVPILQHGATAAGGYPDSIISQFHGENLVMSWYMIRKAEMKYVVWGTGKEHPPQLFNVTSDPNEMTNLALQKTPAVAALIAELDADLRKQVDYPVVSMDVATYNIEMARWWMDTTPTWASIVNGTWAVTGNGSYAQSKRGELNEDWGALWQTKELTGHGPAPSAYWDAWNAWVHDDPVIAPCGDELTHNWPKTASRSFYEN